MLPALFSHGEISEAQWTFAAETVTVFDPQFSHFIGYCTDDGLAYTVVLDIVARES
jgi:hypothetical protein